MRMRRCVLVCLIGCLLMATGSGCAWWRRVTGRGGTDELEPISFDDIDFPLADRPSLGTLVPVTFDHVLFAFDSYMIQSGEYRKIEAVADYLRRNPRVQLVAEGHCDERGSREYNMSLGEHRALAVRAHLIGLGIETRRIQTRSFGEERPLDPGHHEAAWSRNRRVEFVMYE